MNLLVTVPAGVRVVRGAVSFTLPDASQQPVVEYDYEFSYGDTPGEDVVVIVDGQSDAMGAHASDAFRFGRPEPQQPHPVPAGPALVLGGRNWGSAVPATP